MTEQQLANEIMGWMKTFGWLAFHVRSSGRMNNGHPVSVVQGDKGFPDLIGIHRKQNRILAAELKVGKAGTKAGDPRPEQWMWLNAFGQIGNELWHPIETYVWRPEDLPRIIINLRGKI
jgi:hypothetical protein